MLYKAALREEDAKKQEIDFEKMMVVNNPELYQRYSEEKRHRENEQFSLAEEQIEWRTPESIEEVEMLTRINEDISRQLQEQMKSGMSSGYGHFEDQFVGTDEEFFSFHGVDVGKIGDDE